MPPRAYWKGHLRFSLISIPVRLYSATENSANVSFRQIHRDTQQRVRHQPMAGDTPVSRSEIVKGYEYEKDKYVIVEPEELDKLKPRTDKTIEVVQFIETQELDELYVDRPYYLAPDGRVAMEPFAVMREAMNRTAKAALGRITLSHRESLIAISPRHRGMTMLTLRYAREVREAEAYFSDIEDVEIEDQKLKLAEQLISGMTGPFDLSQFTDRYEEALLEMLRAKIEGEEPVVVSEEEPPQTINFMDALRASLEGATDEGGKGKKKKPPAKSVRRSKREPKKKTG